MFRTVTSPIHSYRVINGNTVRVELDLGYHIRITVMLRLTEIVAPGMTGRERNAGEVAARALERWLNQQEADNLEAISRGLDEHGRSVGDIRGFVHCFSAMASVRMRNQGYAVPRGDEPHDWTREELAAIESKEGPTDD